MSNSHRFAFCTQRTRTLAIAVAIAVATGLFGTTSHAEQSSANGEKSKAMQTEPVYIPYEEFTLPNGLRVIVHTDRKAPIVAVNVWYHVGSKDEEPGRTGFAHLFEHLMFQGSENYKGEYFEPFEKVGATDMNGTTNQDRTNYFQNVPTTALDTALWMESDRMGHFLGAVNEDLLNEQRGVVQNEKRQGENNPYGQVWNRLTKVGYPEGHPYSWSTIGSMADLNAAKLDDVQRWFKAWYGPNNAVLVLAGDIDLATAKAKVTKYFGDIPAGPDMPQPKVNIAKRDKSTRETMTDRVPQARIYRVWNVAEYGHPDLTQLSLLAQVLAGSGSSRLERRLVHDEKLADQVNAFAYGQQLSGNFMIQVDVKQGVDPAKVETILSQELGKLVADGPRSDELDRARTVFKAGFIRGIERIGGFGGKADALAECATYTGNPGCYRNDLKLLDVATVKTVRKAAKKWLSSGDHTLVVTPGDKPADIVDKSTAKADYQSPPAPAVDSKFKTIKSVVDRSKGVPNTTTFPDLTFPQLQRASLDNGVKIILAERKGLPVVQMSMEFDGGFAADAGRKLGTSSFTMGMLDEGAGEKNALAFAEAAETLGANIGAGSALDGSNVFVSALKQNLDASTALFADAILRPMFDQKEIDRVRATWLATIKQEKARPNSLALRLLPPLMYGEGHPYAIPFSGTGNETSIAALTRDDLVAYHREILRPDNATLIVVGDINMDAVKALATKHFGQWQPTAMRLNEPAIVDVALQTKPRVFLVDQPGAIQATILAGRLLPSTMDPNALEVEIANSVLGGEFSSRLNMNLREDKNWAYGAYSFIQGARGQRPWIAFAPVQIDKTADALKELDREITAYADGKKPAKPDEVAKIQATEVRGLPGSYETANAVLGAIGGIVRFDRPDDYVVQRKAKIETLTPADVNQAAKTLAKGSVTWVVVGDLSKIEAPVRTLNLGEILIIDADGKSVTKTDDKKTASR